MEQQSEIAHVKAPKEQKHKKRTNVILIGLMGAGKSTVGRIIAHRLRLGFLDLDEWIEREQRKKIAQLISEKGEPGFRKLEAQALKDISQVKNHVIVVGGGAIFAPNWLEFKEIGTTVWLDTPVKAIALRLLKKEEELKNRPLLADIVNETDKEIKLQRLVERLDLRLEERLDAYNDADLFFRDAYSCPEECGMRLSSLVEKQNKKRPYH